MSIENEPRPLAAVTVLPGTAAVASAPRAPGVPRSLVVCVAPDGVSDGFAAACAEFDAVVIVREVAAAQHVLARLGDDAPATGGTGDDATSGLRLDRDGHRLTWNGVDLPAAAHERELLGCLLSEPRRAWTHRELYDAVWGGQWFGDPGAVQSTVKRLRARLRAAGATPRIEAVRGVGFALRG